MPRTDRFIAAPILLIAVFAFSTIFAPLPLWATGFEKFDKMPATVQAEYVAVMVDTTQKALRNSGRADFADRIEQLFTKVESGDSMSLGLVELESNIARARLADARNLEKDPKTTRRIAVEDALFVTLEKNKMPMTTPVMNAVLDAMDKFHPQTYAEFENKSPTEQRNNIALLAKLGYPDSVFRDEVEDRLAKKEPTFHDPELRKQMVDLVAQQFPIGSSDQPGFAPVARDIAGEYAKTPDKAGVLYSLVIYVLTQLSAQLDARDKELDARSVVLPDDRHVSSSQGPAPEPTKSAATQVTVAPPPPSAPAAPPPPAAAPSSPPATSSDDDAFGSGGFITPPSVYNVLLCVEQPLVDRQSWNSPAAGGKMDLFKSAVARYITSIAKPDWQYWIGERQFDAFNPQANAGGDTLISRALESPDPFNPSCPSGYPAYWLKVQH